MLGQLDSDSELNFELSLEVTKDGPHVGKRSHDELYALSPLNLGIVLMMDKWIAVNLSWVIKAKC